MSTFTRRTTIAWDKDSFAGMMTTESQQATNTAAFAELTAKTTEMISAGKMSTRCDLVTVNNSRVISTRWLSDQSAADEWASFCLDFANRYNFIRIYTSTLSV